MKMPTADQVAVAITAAAREIAPGAWAAISLAVARGESSKLPPFDIPQARAYAALALSEVFKCGPVMVSRLVNASSPAAFMSTLQSRIRRNDMKWFDRATLGRVVAALKAVSKPEPLDVPVFLPCAPVKLPATDGPYVSAFKPLPSKRQIEARNALAEAVRNTAALPIPK